MRSSTTSRTRALLLGVAVAAAGRRCAPTSVAAQEDPYGGTTTTTGTGADVACELHASERQRRVARVGHRDRRQPRHSRARPVRRRGGRRARPPIPRATSRSTSTSRSRCRHARRARYEVYAVGPELLGAVRDHGRRRGVRGGPRHSRCRRQRRDRVPAAHRCRALRARRARVHGDRRRCAAACRRRAAGVARATPRRRSLSTRRRPAGVRRRVRRFADAGWHHGPVRIDAGDDGLKEACGVIGVYAPGQPVAHLTYLGLFALQHRGQESAGMAVSDGDSIVVLKDQGLVASVFDERKLAEPRTRAPRGRALPLLDDRLEHVAQRAAVVPQRRRRSRDRASSRSATTATSSTPRRSPPRPACSPAPSPATPTWSPSCSRPSCSRHDDAGDGRDLERALERVLPRLEGAFSFVLMDESHVIGVRDPHGFRPLCLGRLDERLGARVGDAGARHRRRPLRPRARSRRDGRHRRRRRAVAAPVPRRSGSTRSCACSSSSTSPDPTAASTAAASTRRASRMGEQLAEQAPVDADMVMGVPESGVPAAEGFAKHSGIPYGQGLVKNRYIGRTLHRAEPGAARAGGAHEAQPAARERRRQAPRRRRRLDRARHHARSRSCACCARPARPRSTCASRRRR